ncbi:transglutaminase-like cysteine peptidase [Pelagibacterium luteolum]|uniref:Predicted transglutaminase-like cysteine proteinase n=1 Tax=Pelagibacterium luteolum TaxID=440168 RepID=A0A1G7XH24_9HYPH|nr:transglutaminase-like cysteine peptidase [Pelagibacterium luteolum]SDG83373.1 Predicted transglutaminase-like cysteine proteinase [Pelagibacterium luteolum]
MKNKSILISGLLALTVSFAAAAPVAAQDVASLHPAYATTMDLTSIPVGHAEFCERRPYDCQPMAPTAPVSLTDALWAELQDVNNHYNTTITAMSDQDLYGVPEFWTLPTSGYGDCEDISLAKRAALIERGWSPANLLISVVMQPNGEGHAVLMVRTDRGDLVLDNQEGLIKIWTDTPYTFLKRQSQAHAGQWVDILDGRDNVVTATAAY